MSGPGDAHGVRLVVADRILTMDPARPEARALVVDGDRIVAVGDEDSLRRDHPDAVREVFPGATVIPGLVESHVHPAYAGFTQGWADCRAERCRSIADIQAALRALPTPEGGWLIGWGYDDTMLAEQRHPDRADLDAVSATTPILIRHISGHFAVGNSAALAASGLDEESVSADDGGFPRDAAGRLTGLAWELDAVHRLGAALPAASRAQTREAIRAALTKGRRRGVTAVHDMGVGLFGGPDEIEAYRELREAGQLPVRVVGYLLGPVALAEVARDPGFFRAQRDDPWFRIRGAKFWADGSIQGLSAALRLPYVCDHSLTGDLLQPPEVLAEQVAAVSRAGGQVAVHANGDRAVGVTVEALAAVAGPDNPDGLHHRIEHCQVTTPADLEAIARAGLSTSFFINHVWFWGDRHRDRFLGRERAARLDPLAEADALGILFGLHSDCPITPMDPLATMGHAVNRVTSGGAPLGPEQRLTPERAVRAMTIDSARLVGDETRIGSLEAGKAADFVVLPGALEEALVAGGPDPVAVCLGGRWVQD